MFVIFAHAELTAHNTLGSCTDSNRGKEQNVLREESATYLRNIWSVTAVIGLCRSRDANVLNGNDCSRIIMRRGLKTCLMSFVSCSGSWMKSWGCSKASDKKTCGRKPLNSLTPLRGRQISPRLDPSYKRVSALSRMMTGVGLSGAVRAKCRRFLDQSYTPAVHTCDLSPGMRVVNCWAFDSAPKVLPLRHAINHAQSVIRFVVDRR